ncbi:MAG: hypothetical protein JSS27_12990 [Planctomycetes bacterium]|nr:hypothetical protein [Planctomycetota bacterium]
MLNKHLRNRRGQAMVEYAIIIGAVVLVGIGALSLLGHKATDLVGITAALLPGHDADTTGAIFSGELVQTTNSGGVIGVAGVPGSATASLGINVDGNLVTDTVPSGSGS